MYFLINCNKQKSITTKTEKRKQQLENKIGEKLVIYIFNNSGRERERERKGRKYIYQTRKREREREKKHISQNIDRT